MNSYTDSRLRHEIAKLREEIGIESPEFNQSLNNMDKNKLKSTYIKTLNQWGKHKSGEEVLDEATSLADRIYEDFGAKDSYMRFHDEFLDYMNPDSKTRREVNKFTDDKYNEPRIKAEIAKMKAEEQAEARKKADAERAERARRDLAVATISTEEDTDRIMSPEQVRAEAERRLRAEAEKAQAEEERKNLENAYRTALNDKNKNFDKASESDIRKLMKMQQKDYWDNHPIWKSDGTRNLGEEEKRKKAAAQALERIYKLEDPNSEKRTLAQREYAKLLRGNADRKSEKLNYLADIGKSTGDFAKKLGKSAVAGGKSSLSKAGVTTRY